VLSFVDALPQLSPFVRRCVARLLEQVLVITDHPPVQVRRRVYLESQNKCAEEMHTRNFAQIIVQIIQLMHRISTFLYKVTYLLFISPYIRTHSYQSRLYRRCGRSFLYCRVYVSHFYLSIQSHLPFAYFILYLYLYLIMILQEVCTFVSLLKRRHRRRRKNNSSSGGGGGGFSGGGGGGGGGGVGSGGGGSNGSRPRSALRRDSAFVRGGGGGGSGGGDGVSAGGVDDAADDDAPLLPADRDLVAVVLQYLRRFVEAKPRLREVFRALG
jgi:hypothetical protein